MRAKIFNGVLVEYVTAEPQEDVTEARQDKPHVVPVVVENEAYDAVSEAREGPIVFVERDKVRHVYNVRPKSDEEVAVMRLAKVAQIKAEARRRILEILPDYAQVNALARGQEMTMEYGSDPERWPDGAKADHAAVMRKWAAIKALRLRSDELEVELAKLQTAALVNNFDPLRGWE
jgi:hypothetical protein